MESLTRKLRTGLTSLSTAWPSFSRNSVRADVTMSGFQEARVRVRDGYEPRTPEVMQGVPVRLHFQRDEDAECSERVIFSGIRIDRRLPAFRETTIEFTPHQAGTFLFRCHMGMYSGTLVVRPAKNRTDSSNGVVS